MRKLLPLLLTIILLILIPGCGLATIPEPHLIEEEHSPVMTPQPTVPPAPRKGGELRVALTAPDSMIPLLTQSRDVLNFLSLIFESPIAYDANSKPIPSLIESWEVSPDGRLWVFDVRKGVKWHNNQNMTGEDILFTFQLLQSGVLNSFFQKNLYENSNIVDFGLRNEDPYTFYIRLGEPTYRILDILTFPVLPKNVYQSEEYLIGIGEDFTQLPIGTGPYRVDPAHPFDGSTVRLVQNENWWGGEPYINSILGRAYETNDEGREAFQEGQVDLVDTTVVYANALLDRNNAGHYKYLTPDIEFLAVNSTNQLLQDKAVKKAIAYAIDRKDIISRVYLNNAETVDVPIPANNWLYDSRYRIYDYDAKRARRLLLDAGWGDSDGDGILDMMIDGQKTDLTFSILTNGDNDFRRDAALLIAKQLELVGFHIQVEIISWGTMQEERIPNGEFDVILTGYSLDTVHDLSFFLHSDQIGNELNNFIGYSNAELDQLLDKAAIAYTEEERGEAYQGIQRHLTDELPIISLYFRTGSVLFDNRIHGMDRIGEWNMFRNIKDWFLVR